MDTKCKRRGSLVGGGWMTVIGCCLLLSPPTRHHAHAWIPPPSSSKRVSTSMSILHMRSPSSNNEYDHEDDDDDDDFMMHPRQNGHTVPSTKIKNNNNKSSLAQQLEAQSIQLQRNTLQGKPFRTTAIPVTIEYPQNNNDHDNDAKKDTEQEEVSAPSSCVVPTSTPQRFQYKHHKNNNQQQNTPKSKSESSHGSSSSFSYLAHWTHSLDRLPPPAHHKEYDVMFPLCDFYFRLDPITRTLSFDGYVTSNSLAQLCQLIHHTGDVFVAVNGVALSEDNNNTDTTKDTADSTSSLAVHRMATLLAQSSEYACFRMRTSSSTAEAPLLETQHDSVDTMDRNDADIPRESLAPTENPTRTKSHDNDTHAAAALLQQQLDHWKALQTTHQGLQDELQSQLDHVQDELREIQRRMDETTQRLQVLQDKASQEKAAADRHNDKKTFDEPVTLPDMDDLEQQWEELNALNAQSTNAPDIQSTTAIPMYPESDEMLKTNSGSHPNEPKERPFESWSKPTPTQETSDTSGDQDHIPQNDNYAFYNQHAGGCWQPEFSQTSFHNAKPDGIHQQENAPKVNEKRGEWTPSVNNARITHFYNRIRVMPEAGQAILCVLAVLAQTGVSHTTFGMLRNFISQNLPRQGSLQQQHNSMIPLEVFQELLTQLEQNQLLVVGRTPPGKEQSFDDFGGRAKFLYHTPIYLDTSNQKEILQGIQTALGSNAEHSVLMDATVRYLEHFRFIIDDQA